jgi:hypothetical protein
VAGRIRPIEKSNYLIRNGTRDLPACSIACIEREAVQNMGKGWEIFHPSVSCTAAYSREDQKIYLET